MFTMQNGFGIPLPHLFRMQKPHQAVLEEISILLLHFGKRIRLSDLERRYYRNIIHVLDNSVLIFISVDYYFSIVFLIAKLYLWGCRRNQTLPSITGFSSKVKIKNETEKSKYVKTNQMDKFNKKWALPLDSVPQ